VASTSSGDGATRRSAGDRARFWRGVIGRWQRSGLSQAEYCRKTSLSPGSFRWWKYRITIRDERRRAPVPRRIPERQGSSEPPLFLPVRVIGSPASSTPAPMEIALKGGRTVRIQSDCDAGLLAKVIAVLESRSC
jgi:hypothetical protein